MDSDALASFDRERYLSLETFKRNGDGVKTPVWFAAGAGKLWVFTEAKAWKVVRLRNDSRIRVAACNVRGGVRGDWIPGTGRSVDESALVADANDALLAKYGWQMRLTNLASRLAGRIEGRAILELSV